MGRAEAFTRTPGVSGVNRKTGDDRRHAPEPRRGNRPLENRQSAPSKTLASKVGLWRRASQDERLSVPVTCSNISTDFPEKRSSHAAAAYNFFVRSLLVGFRRNFRSPIPTHTLAFSSVTESCESKSIGVTGAQTFVTHTTSIHILQGGY
jgi:hypothetical protein